MLLTRGGSTCPWRRELWEEGNREVFLTGVSTLAIVFISFQCSCEDTHNSRKRRLWSEAPFMYSGKRKF